MHDPLLNCMALGGSDTCMVNIDVDRVTVGEFEAATVLSDIVWGPEGFAEMLGPTWAMVHDPRFIAVEREGVISKRSMSGALVPMGPSLIQALDMVSTIEVIDDLTIYSEMLGEGRHFLKAALDGGIDPHALQDDEAAIWKLITNECANYRHRNGSWNDDAKRLERMLSAGLVGLIADYAEIAYSQDWIRMDTNTVVEASSRALGDDGDMDAPTVAVEVDTIQRALTMRAQVRVTALRLLRQFPGIKPEEFEALTLTDAEADQLCQILFKAKGLDKLYTVMPEVLNLMNRVRAASYAEREAQACKERSAGARDFCAKLTSGEIKPIVTSLEDDGTEEPTTAAFILNLMGDEVKRAQFQAIQMFEADGDPEAIRIVKGLLESNGSEASWTEVVTHLQGQLSVMHTERTRSQLDEAINHAAPEAVDAPTERNVTVVEGGM